MQTKAQHYERVKLLTETGKHLEAQALYEKLIDRKEQTLLLLLGCKQSECEQLTARLLGELLLCQ